MIQFILSFVVQNFYSQPFLPNTQNYNNFVISNNTQLLYLFIKENGSYSWGSALTILTNSPGTFLFNNIFTKRFYKFFKRLYTNQLGLMSINLTNSSLHNTFSDLNALIALNRPVLNPVSHFFCAHNVKYLQPITLITFSFHKTTYNTLMIYVMLLLTNFYTPSQNEFKLYYSFIIQPANLAIYPFLNFFYFKIRQF